MSEWNELAKRYEQKAANGLVNVRLTVSSPREASLAELCKEALALDDAIERGDCTPLDFGDRKFRRPT